MKVSYNQKINRLQLEMPFVEMHIHAPARLYDIDNQKVRLD